MNKRISEVAKEHDHSIGLERQRAKRLKNANRALGKTVYRCGSCNRVIKTGCYCARCCKETNL